MFERKKMYSISEGVKFKRVTSKEIKYCQTYQISKYIIHTVFVHISHLQQRSCQNTGCILKLYYLDILFYFVAVLNLFTLNVKVLVLHSTIISHLQRRCKSDAEKSKDQMYTLPSLKQGLIVSRWIQFNCYLIY